MRIIQVYTIGVYDYTEDQFFSKLLENGINHFVDIRRRRGMRGSKYSFVNSIYLQEKLEKFNINYVHLKELAPINETRGSQKEEDKLIGESKRTREHLSDTFIQRYTTECLDRFDVQSFFKRFDRDSKVALFCVESNPEACHRGLVAQRLGSLQGIEVHHIIEK